MPESDRDLCVTMVNDSLIDTGLVNITDNYSVKWYATGDEKLWIKIHQVADRYNKITNQLFFDQFSDIDLNLPDRQCYMFVDKTKVIGTCTAWEDKKGMYAGYGLVHWMAVIPEYQRKGIGKMLLSIICQRMISLGYQKAYLKTSTLRKPAIELYKRFGFQIRDITEWN